MSTLRLLAAGLVVAAAAAFLVGFTSRLGRTVDPAVAVCTTAVVVLVAWGTTRTWRAVSTPWSPPSTSPDDGIRDPRLRTLSWAALRPDTGAWQHTTSPLLRDVLRHALHTRHGIDLDREPGRAKAVLPAELHPLVDDPDRAPVDTAHLAALVDRIEELCRTTP